ncbi:MAG: protein kinase domain-containing protein, partial [Pirellula sp.]
MAPEVQLLGGQAATSASDVYSLGVLLYVLLTDQRPFPSLRFIDSLNQPQAPLIVWPDMRRIPKDLRAIAAKCLSKSPSNRYRDAGILADDLDRFLQDQPVLARQRNRIEIAWNWLRKHPSFAMLVPIVLVSIGAWSLNLQSQRRQLQKALSRAEQGEKDARTHADAAFLRLASNAIKAREFELARQYLDRAIEFDDPNTHSFAEPSLENRYLRGLLPDPKSIAVIDAHSGGVTSVVTMNEIRAVASAGSDGLIAVWKIPSLDLMHAWHAHEGDINRLARMDPGGAIASCGDDGYVRVWDAQTGVLKREHFFGKRLFELAFCQQGRVLLVGGDLSEIIGWDWDRDLENFRIPAAQVRAMAVDPLGERVAYADMTTGLSLVNLKSNGVEPPILLTADPRINDLK